MRPVTVKGNSRQCAKGKYKESDALCKITAPEPSVLKSDGGFSDSYIQTRLRWRGTTWMDYLRNTLYSAQQHTKALSIPANNLPHLCHPRTGTVLPRHRELETLENVLQVAPAA